MTRAAQSSREQIFLLEYEMNFERHVNRALDEEHRANLELLLQVEQVLARPTPAGTEPIALAGRLLHAVEHEITRHFGLEEREIFPRMEAAGEGDMASLLLEEHDTIRAVANELLPLLREATRQTLDGAGWTRLRRGALEFSERLRAHIDKETLAMLPLLEDLLDEETDRELAFNYASDA
jgi:hemerythrin-like domain-containing protein